MISVPDRPDLGTSDLVAGPDLRPYLAPARAIGLSTVEVGTSALEGLPRLLERLAPMDPSPPVVAVMADSVRKTRRGSDVTDQVAALCGSVGAVRRVPIPTHGGRAHADERTLAAAVEACRGASMLVSVGSGTVTDIAKAVAARLGLGAHVVVQTALSVNGYADDQSVVEVNGVKRTTRTRWPDALVADSGVLAEAPPALNTAGVGDLLAMFTAPADWRLASELGMDDTFSQEPVSMVRAHGAALLHAAPRLAAEDPAAIDLVARVLTLSGLSMGLAGTTAPASGMEHAVSHLLDMAASRDGRLPALHGAQVGVAAVVASVVWRRVLDAVRTGSTRLVAPSDDEVREEVRSAFTFLDDEGSAAAECWRDCQRKLVRWRLAHGEASVLDPSCLGEPARLLEAPEALVDALRNAGAPARFSELDPPVPAGRVRWALANCHLLRERFSVADLAQRLGIWGPAAVDEVLAEADEVGAGL